MTLTVNDILPCLEGVIPATIVTADPDGLPNVTALSKVDYVDAHHVALTRQFFRKTAKNLASNPRACVLVTDPAQYRGYKLYLRYVRSETEGPLFERMRLRIETIASLMGMEEVFRLQAADIFLVEAIEDAQNYVT
jgi:hypothetical protein